MIENTHDRYVCISPVYRGGRLYKLGDEMLLPVGETYKGKNFELVSEGKKEKPPKTKKPAKKEPEEKPEDKETTSEVEV